MTKAKLIKEICKREGKKSQVAIGNVREIVAVIEQMIAEQAVKDGMNPDYVNSDSGVLGALIPGVRSKMKKLLKKKK